MENSLPQLLHALAMLGLVLAMIGALAWSLRRWQGLETVQGKEGWRVRRRLPLTAQHSLVEVTDGETDFVVILGPQTSTVLKSSAVVHSKQPVKPAKKVKP